jgi:hypothetical protein
MKGVCRIVFAAMLGAALAACGTRAIKPEDGGLPVYRLDDGSLCKAPPNFEDIVNAAPTQQMLLLFNASAPPADVAAGIVDLPPRQNIDAAFYVSCAQYAGGELSDNEFNRERRIWQEFRQAHMTRGIREWRDDPEGYEEPGKICHFIFNHGLPDVRDVTRLVPAETSVDDCAIFVSRNGGKYVLLGCSNGRWDTQWAQAPLLAGPNGWAVRSRSAVGTHYVPDPNCGWY